MGDVAADSDNRSAKLGAQLLGPGRNSFQNSNARPFCDEARHHGSADPRAAPGNQRYLPIEPTHDAVLFLRVSSVYSISGLAAIVVGSKPSWRLPVRWPMDGFL